MGCCEDPGRAIKQTIRNKLCSVALKRYVATASEAQRYKHAEPIAYWHKQAQLNNANNSARDSEYNSPAQTQPVCLHNIHGSMHAQLNSTTIAH